MRGVRRMQILSSVMAVLRQRIVSDYVTPFVRHGRRLYKGIGAQAAVATCDTVGRDLFASTERLQIG